MQPQAFRQAHTPGFPYSEAQLLALAEQIVRRHITVTGVQPKLSLTLVATGDARQPTRFTIVGTLEAYILKPPTLHYPSLRIGGLDHALGGASGPGYYDPRPAAPGRGHAGLLTRRIDQYQGQKLAMEDRCQLTERLTQNKYDGSHEQVANTILRYAANPGLDVVNYYELVLFCFLTGNAGMHLKNFSLLHTPDLRPGRHGAAGPSVCAAGTGTVVTNQLAG